MAVVSASAIFAGAGTLNLLEAAIPGGPELSLIPGIGAYGLALALYLLGERIPVGALAALGPVGVALIGVAVGTTAGPGDGAILYVWPVLWEAYFFGRWGAILIVAWTALVQGLALIAVSAGDGYFDRWLDVVVSVGVVAVVVELLSSRNRKLLVRLAEEAKVDNLTGLLNRRGFAERAEAELARARRDGTRLGVVSFDLDHFKAINDEFGHDVGDRVLVEAAELFRSELRESDVLARMGGEEFVALLPGDAVAEAEAMAERVRAALVATAASSTPAVTVSAGVTAAIAPEDLEDLLRSADRALYRAKFEGRNRTATFALP